MYILFAWLVGGSKLQLFPLSFQKGSRAEAKWKIDWFSEAKTYNLFSGTIERKENYNSEFCPGFAANNTTVCSRYTMDIFRCYQNMSSCITKLVWIWIRTTWIILITGDPATYRLTENAIPRWIIRPRISLQVRGAGSRLGRGSQNYICPIVIITV